MILIDERFPEMNIMIGKESCSADCDKECLLREYL